MKKIVALVLSLVMALSLCTVAFAAGYDIETARKYADDNGHLAHEKYDNVKYVEQTNTVLGHYETKDGEWFVETADDDVYDNETEWPFILTIQKDGKVVYLAPVYEEEVAKVNAWKADKVAEHKYVGCGDENDKAPKDCYKDVETKDYWVKCEPVDADRDGVCDKCNWSVNDHRYVTVDGKWDNVVSVRPALVFGESYDLVKGVPYPNGYWKNDAEVVPAGHLMVLVKKNIEYKTSTDGKIVKDVNEYKCYFCNRTFYGSNYEYSTPETADIYNSQYALQLVDKGFVNVEDGVILGDVEHYWTTDKDNGTKADDTKKGVDSAKTFDAGVAMYVGMSLLSVAGGAVVIGKKKEF